MVRPWVAIQRNPTSGDGAKRGELLALCFRLRELGLRPHLFSSRERLNARINRPGGREGLVCVVAAGGDGTVADLNNRFPDLPLTVLPLGTENLLARYFGIPCDGACVAEVIAAGHRWPIDVGVMNGRRFMAMVSAGFDAEIVHRTHARRQGHIRKWNYLQPLAETLRSYRYPKLRIHIDESDRGPGDSGPGDVNQKTSGSHPLVGRMAVVANLPAYALDLPIAANALGNDGLLDLRLFERPSAFQMLYYLYKVARREHEALPDVRVARVRRVRIDSDVPVPLQCDGDPSGSTPAEISILPHALTLLVPAGSPPLAQAAQGAAHVQTPDGNLSV